jgi:hypothetical protein
MYVKDMPLNAMCPLQAAGSRTSRIETGSFGFAAFDARAKALACPLRHSRMITLRSSHNTIRRYRHIVEGVFSS